jgi:hypothetical protein
VNMLGELLDSVIDGVFGRKVQRIVALVLLVVFVLSGTRSSRTCTSSTNRFAPASIRRRGSASALTDTLDLDLPAYAGEEVYGPWGYSSEGKSPCREATIGNSTASGTRGISAPTANTGRRAGTNPRPL